MRFFMIIALAVFGLSQIQTPVCATDARPHEIRVGLTMTAAGRKSVTISSHAGLTISSFEADIPAISIPKDIKYVLSLGTRTITGGKSDSTLKPLGSQITIFSGNRSEAIQIQLKDRFTKRYLGALEVTARDDRIQLVNVLDMETYLRGVVSNEMQSKSPSAALQAQAICARSWAYRNLHKHGLDGFDVCESTHCQVYGGASSQHPTTDAAVSLTTGLVITYMNELASVMYSSDSGGVTQDYAELKGTSRHPYLTSVMDPPEIPHRSWTQRFQLSELESKLLSSGIRDAKGLTSISISRTGTGGRVLTVALIKPDGQTEIPAEKLRSALGVSVIKSTLFALDVSSPGYIVFSGRGYGHGIGMCQTGAKALAAAPFNYSYEQILSHYFPGTQLGVVERTGSTTASRGTTNRNARRASVVKSR